MKNKWMDNLVFIIFFIVGLIFFIVGIYFGCNTLFSKNKKEIVAEVTDIYDGNTYVKYEVNEISYESVIRGTSSAYHVGSEVTIYYNTNDPSKASFKELDFFFYIFGGMGLLFMLIGLIPFVFKLKKRIKYKRLKENGRLVFAKYVETVYNTMYAVNGRHPFNIICSYSDPYDGKEYLYKSENIWFNPDVILSKKTIRDIPVYIDKDNKKIYYVDIESISKDIVDLT